MIIARQLVETKRNARTTQPELLGLRTRFVGRPTALTHSPGKFRFLGLATAGCALFYRINPSASSPTRRRPPRMRSPSFGTHRGARRLPRGGELRPSPEKALWGRGWRGLEARGGTASRRPYSSWRARCSLPLPPLSSPSSSRDHLLPSSWISRLHPCRPRLPRQGDMRPQPSSWCWESTPGLFIFIFFILVFCKNTCPNK